MPEVMRDRIWKRVRWETGGLYDVGVRADGSLHNPNGYPETDVKAAIRAAEERLHRRRSETAQKAAVTRAQRREKRVIEAARRILTGYGIGERQRCFICHKRLSDPDSIRRGIGSECWQGLLTKVVPIPATPGPHSAGEAFEHTPYPRSPWRDSLHSSFPKL